MLGCPLPKSMLNFVKIHWQNLCDFISDWILMLEQDKSQTKKLRKKLRKKLQLNRLNLKTKLKINKTLKKLATWDKSDRRLLKIFSNEHHQETEFTCVYILFYSMWYTFQKKLLIWQYGGSKKQKIQIINDHNIPPTIPKYMLLHLKKSFKLKIKTEFWTISKYQSYRRLLR